jgi:hypothetical protein
MIKLCQDALSEPIILIDDKASEKHIAINHAHSHYYSLIAYLYYKS